MYGWLDVYQEFLWAERINIGIYSEFVIDHCHATECEYSDRTVKEWEEDEAADE